MDPVHITRSSLVATTSDIRDEFARVQVRSELTNDTDVDTTVTVEMTIHDATGRVVARLNEDKAVPPFGTKPFSMDLDVLRPHRWSIDDPYLYRVESTVRVAGRTIDQERIPLGIRTAEFTVDNGFLLNGRRVPLQGVCLHHDLGALGAAAFDRGIERQLEIMKSMGVNAIRTSPTRPRRPCSTPPTGSGSW